MSRVILFFDLDCFYCQVESRRLGLERDVPLAVQQWQGIIASNYAARALGVDRHTQINKADSRVRMVHVEVLGVNPSTLAKNLNASNAKTSLKRYRDASCEVMCCIQKFLSKLQAEDANKTVPACILERASIDEIYIDVTKFVRHSESFQGTEDLPMVDTIVIGESSEKETQCNDQNLKRGVHLMTKIRQAVEAETKFQMSGACAANKVLAKVACSKYKPNKQTLVPNEAAASWFLKSTKVTKVPGFGGKLGEKVTRMLTEVNPEKEVFLLQDIADNLHNVNFSNHAISASSKARILQLLEGNDSSKVNPKMAPKSLLSEKIFRDPKPRGEKSINAWLKVLVTEIFDRASTDTLLHGRVPSKVHMSYRSVKAAKSKGVTMNVPNPNPFLANAKTYQSSSSSSEEDRHIANMVVLCSKEIDKSSPLACLTLCVTTFKDAVLNGSWVSQNTTVDPSLASFFTGKTSSSFLGNKSDNNVELESLKPLRKKGEELKNNFFTCEANDGDAKKKRPIREMFKLDSEEKPAEGVVEKGLDDEIVNVVPLEKKQSSERSSSQMILENKPPRRSIAELVTESRKLSPTKQQQENVLVSEAASNAFNMMLMASIDMSKKRKKRKKKQ